MKEISQRKLSWEEIQNVSFLQKILSEAEEQAQRNELKFLHNCSSSKQWETLRTDLGSKFPLGLLGAYAFDDPAARPIPAAFLKQICPLGNSDFQVFGDRIQSVVLPQWFPRLLPSSPPSASRASSLLRPSLRSQGWFEILNQVPRNIALGISVQMLLFHHGTLTSVTATFFSTLFFLFFKIFWYTSTYFRSEKLNLTPGSSFWLNK